MAAVQDIPPVICLIGGITCIILSNETIAALHPCVLFRIKFLVLLMSS